VGYSISPSRTFSSTLSSYFRLLRDPFRVLSLFLFRSFFSSPSSFFLESFSSASLYPPAALFGFCLSPRSLSVLSGSVKVSFYFLRRSALAYFRCRQVAASRHPSSSLLNAAFGGAAVSLYPTWSAGPNVASFHRFRFRLFFQLVALSTPLCTFFRFFLVTGIASFTGPFRPIKIRQASPVVSFLVLRSRFFDWT